MKKTGSKSLPALARLALAAVRDVAEAPLARAASPLSATRPKTGR